MKSSHDGATPPGYDLGAVNATTAVFYGVGVRKYLRVKLIFINF